jgi:ABC-2 type transport system permease protein
MSPRTALATAVRVAIQLRRDPRTLALLLLVPPLLVALLRWLYDRQPPVLDRAGPALVGVFPFVTMFLVTSVVTLRERTGGTLERLLTTRLSKIDLLLGYAVAFAAVALLQVALTSALAFGPLGFHGHGHVLEIGVLALVNAVLGMALGLCASAFAATEFQAVQFLPAVVLPQFLLCGLLVPHEQMPQALQILAAFMPLHYSVDGITRSAASGWTAHVALDLAVTLACTTGVLLLGAATLRRRTS